MRLEIKTDMADKEKKNDGAFTPPSLKETLKALEKRLDKKRFAHTLSVAYTAANLAAVYGEDANKALFAGLLHDCAKNLSDKELLAACKKNALPVSEAENAAPYLLHGKVGALLAEEEFQVRDDDILNAIRSHTTGRPEMSLLERIVFVADYMEPWRSHASNLPEIRREAYRDLDAALVHILKDTLTHLSEAKAVVDPQTRKTYEYYRDLTGDC